MKIAYIFRPPFDPQPDGALGIWNREITRRIARNSDVIVYAPLSRGQKRFQFIDGVHYRCISLGFDHWLARYLDALRRRSIITFPLFGSSLYYAGFALQVAVDLRTQRCDVVHIHDLSQFVPIIRALNRRIRIVLHMHGEWLTQLARKTIEPRLKSADMILACSEYVANKIRASFPEHAHRCRTIYMGVDPEVFHPNPGLRPPRDSMHNRLLYVGRISPEKGVHVLLESFRKIAEIYPQTQLDIVGPDWVQPRDQHIDMSDDPRMTALKVFHTGNYRSLLEKQIPSHLRSKIKFHGLVPHSELPRYYQNADIYISPSFYESFGMSNLEAMASDCPVIATRVGGVPEAVTHDKNGILIEPGTPDQLTSAILHLLSDQQLRNSLGQAAHRRAVDRFAWDRLCQDLLRLYAHLYTQGCVDNSILAGEEVSSSHEIVPGNTSSH